MCPFLYCGKLPRFSWGAGQKAPGFSSRSAGASSVPHRHREAARPGGRPATPGGAPASLGIPAGAPPRLGRAVGDPAQHVVIAHHGEAPESFIGFLVDRLVLPLTFSAHRLHRPAWLRRILGGGTPHHWAPASYRQRSPDDCRQDRESRTSGCHCHLGFHPPRYHGSGGR